jgi:phage gp29-like protein
MGPNRSLFHDIPITSFSGWSKVSEIEGILNEHDLGYFRRSAMLVDAMMRDDRIAAVADTRVGSLLATPVRAKPADARAKASKIASKIGGDDDNPGIFWQLFPAEDVRALSEWGNFLGIGVAEIIWQTTNEDWTPRLKIWHPQFVWWHRAEMRYYITTIEGIIPLPRVDEQPRSDGKWIVWCPYGYRYGWLRALVRRLAHKYIMRGWDYRDWAGYNERHGNPIIGAQTPAMASEESKTTFVNQLANIGSNPTVELPTGEAGNAYDLKLIEAKSKSWQSFQEFKKEIDADIAIAILGQDMTTQSSASGLGGGKQAAVHEKVALDRRRQDAKLATCLREQGLTYWAKFNLGDPEIAPVLTFDTDPPEDENQEGLALKGLGDALTALRPAAEGAIDERAILDEWGVPMLSEAEVAAKKQQAQEEARQQMEDQAAAGVPPGGALPAAGQKPGGAAPPKPGQPPGKPAPGTPPAKQMKLSMAAADDGTEAALIGLVARASNGTALRNSRTANGSRRAKLYSDRVADNAVKIAARVIAPDLAGLKAEIDAASDFADLKRRIIARYKDMSPEALAEVVRKATLLAHLGGRVTAIKQI